MTEFELRSYAKPRRSDDPAVVNRAKEIAAAGGWGLAGIYEEMDSGQCFALERTVEGARWWPIDA